MESGKQIRGHSFSKDAVKTLILTYHRITKNNQQKYNELMTHHQKIISYFGFCAI